MTDPSVLRPARPPRGDWETRQVKVPCPELNRFFYTAVGGDWHWLDRLKWSYERWLSYLDRPEVQTWVGYPHSPADDLRILQGLAATVTEPPPRRRRQGLCLPCDGATTPVRQRSEPLATETPHPSLTMHNPER